MKDFFRSYRSARIRSLGVSAFFACMLSVGAFSLMQNTDQLSQVSANVLAWVSEAPTYTSELIVEQSGADITVRIGKNAESVDAVFFTLLGDPAKLQSLASTDPLIQIRSETPGVYMVRADTLGKNIAAGHVLAGLHLQSSAPVSLVVTDASFQSQGKSYMLSAETTE